MFNNTEPYLLTASEGLALIKSRKLSALEWVGSCRERIQSRRIFRPGRVLMISSLKKRKAKPERPRYTSWR